MKTIDGAILFSYLQVVALHTREFNWILVLILSIPSALMGSRGTLIVDPKGPGTPGWEPLLYI